MKTTLIVSILSMLVAAMLLPAGAYEPDYIDKERWENRKALRSGNCYWYGTDCPRDRRWGYVPRIPTPSPEVMAAQIKLRELGYDIEHDGLMGPETREALYELQSNAGIPVTGELDERTWEALEERGRTAKIWTTRPRLCREKDGRECTCDPIIIFSGEHVGKDAKHEAVKRWRGHVRSMLGETWMDWAKAPEPKVLDCWFTGTGERTTDKLGQIRCVAQARACFGPPEPGADDAAPVSKRPRED